MRRLLIAIAATALLATPVMAQPYGSGPGPGPAPGYGPGPGAPGPGPGPGSDYRGDDRRGPDYRPEPPRRDWNNRGGRSWNRHVRACSARYRSYNPRTDRYVVRRGVTARCRL